MRAPRVVHLLPFWGLLLLVALAQGKTQCLEEVCTSCSDDEVTCNGCAEGWYLDDDDTCQQAAPTVPPPAPESQDDDSESESESGSGGEYTSNEEEGSDGGGTPNIILFSIDDEIDGAAWRTAYEDTISASNLRNPNGCKIPLTWFVSKGPDKGDCGTAQQALKAGHELATHTLTHPKEGLPGKSYSEISNQIGGGRDWLVGCGIPADVITGFRAPYYQTDSTVGKVLVDLGFQYDSSFTDSSYQQRPGRLDQGFCSGDSDPPCGSGNDWEGLPVWEVPAYRLPGSNKRSDPDPADGMSVLERFKADFERKRGSGVPVNILVHEPYLSDSSTGGEVTDFLSWALDQPNTWVLTYQQLIKWIESGSGSNVASIATSTCGD